MPGTIAQMPAHLVTFDVADWEEFVGPEPQNWGGRLMGVPWVQFKARRLYAQGRADWRRLPSAPCTDAHPVEESDDALAEQKRRSEAMIRSAIETRIFRPAQVGPDAVQTGGPAGF